MLNLSLGTQTEGADGDQIVTHAEARGHALFGPYERLEPGRYVVEFAIALAGLPPSEDSVCAMVDVVSDQGRSDIAFDFVFASQLSASRTIIALTFELDQPRELEYRVHAAGLVPLRIWDAPRVRRLLEGEAAPVRAMPAQSDLLDRHPAMLKRLYDQHVAIAARDGRLVLSLNGIAFNGASYDDVNFVDELFFKSAYNVIGKADACVIDVGMNVGLASLLFAAKPQVREVHAFEPFPSTYERGRANLALNPTLAAKIRPNHFGLGDGDEEATFLIDENHGDTGGMATRSVEGGTPMKLSIRDAATTLRPIIASARERGMKVLTKIDCEGAEFAIFASLARAGLFAEIDALMVEWHRVFDGRDQHELIGPLSDAGFVTFDITPPEGNGFFYAARVG